MRIKEKRMKSFVSRANVLTQAKKQAEAAKVVNDGLQYYSNNVIKAISPYAAADAGMRMELEKFTEEYYRKLEGIGNDKIINMVMRFEAMAAAKGKELVFLCYEDVRIPEDWCHRTVFAQWYCEQTGEIIKELPDPNPPKVKKPPVQKQAKKEESKRTAAQKEAKTETEGYEQMSLFGMAGAMI